MNITLKKTKAASTGYYGAKGKRMVTPASYDIFLDGELVGSLWGFCNTRLSDGGCGHKGKAFGVSLSNPGVRGTARVHMEAEIIKLAEDHQKKIEGK